MHRHNVVLTLEKNIKHCYIVVQIKLAVVATPLRAHKKSCKFSVALHPQRLYGLSGTGAQDGHLNFHTAPDLWRSCKSSFFFFFFFLLLLLTVQCYGSQNVLCYCCCFAKHILVGNLFSDMHPSNTISFHSLIHSSFHSSFGWFHIHTYTHDSQEAKQKWSLLMCSFTWNNQVKGSEKCS